MAGFLPDWPVDRQEFPVPRCITLDPHVSDAVLFRRIFTIALFHFPDLLSQLVLLVTYRLTLILSDVDSFWFEFNMAMLHKRPLAIFIGKLQFD